MRRRTRPDNVAELRSGDRHKWSRTHVSDKSWFISPRSAAVLAMLAALTVLNVLAVQRWHRSRGGKSWGVGDAVEVKVTSGRDEFRCFGHVLSANSSVLLVHFSGHALEGAQWISRESASTPIDPTRPSSRCRYTHAPVAAVAPSGDSGVDLGEGCSRFLRAFCSQGWRRHSRTRHLGAFSCSYPNEDKSDAAGAEGWRLAQDVGRDQGLCPDPSLVLWPPSKVTYPLCSAAIARLSREHGLRLSAHPLPDQRDDTLAHLQALTFGACPSPETSRWTPDATLWPECDHWIRLKCTPGSACDVGSGTSPHTWAASQAQVSFTEAQNWAAGRGKCPSALEGRWRPGLLFYPHCSSALRQWCHSRRAVADCLQAPESGRSWRRSEAQKWVHATSKACPDPDTEFAWPWGLGNNNGEDSLPLGTKSLPTASSGRIQRLKA